MPTYPSCFALVFQSFLRVLSCCLDVVHSMLDVVFDSVYHLTLSKFHFKYTNV